MLFVHERRRSRRLQSAIRAERAQRAEQSKKEFRFMTNTSRGTVRLTVAQALVTYLSRQYSVADGHRRRLIPAALGIFGHGNVAGLGQALDQLSSELPFIQGRNEQALAHMASGYAKATRRHATLAVTASIGPGAMNLVTGAALATVNRLPVLLLPGDTYATRRQGPVLQQLQHPVEADTSVNDALRPVSRFFDRISRPEALLTALPAAMRVLTDPANTGAVVLSLPQDVQSHAYDWPAEMFSERDWVIRRPVPDLEEVDAVARLLAAAERPLIIAGGGVIYSGATSELSELAATAGIPVAETFAGKGAIQQRAWWQLGGIGLEGTPASNGLAAEADLVLTVGSRLTDFATASQSLFQNPDVRFASINVDVRDAGRLGATAIIADAKRALAALTRAVEVSGIKSPAEWQRQVRARSDRWLEERAAALDPDAVFDKSAVPADSDVVTSTDALLTQGQMIGVLQEHARPGDTIIAAAGGPPGDLQKVWDATERRYCHLEFGFSCMGYELPAALGVRLAVPDRSKRVLAFIGDGTFLMAPTELVTAVQERLPVTVVISENHGYQAIHRLQMLRSGREFGNEFRYRDDALALGNGQPVDKPARLDGEYLPVDLVQIASGLGARAVRATTAAEVRNALTETRDHDGPVVIVIPAIPHAELPGAGVWWDVAPAEVSDQETVAQLRAEYEAGLASQRWFG
jgi:3D-(3,5/4)-trihydroxycyclohexane-1,2-dione acylhydrolase (decyclizing)